MELEQLKFLLEKRHRFCVSIFLPTHRAGREIRQDPIRLKNLLKEAESRLIALGQKAMEARELLAPAREFIEPSGFWRYQQDGLAVFVADGLFRYFRVPLRFQELVSVAESFEVSPLLPLYTNGGHFYLLAISRNRARFFYGTSTTLDELDASDIPQGVDEALKFDVRESQLQVHSGAGGSAAGKEGAVFTGQGIGVDDEQKRTHEFLLMVEKRVRHRLREERSPLVLAGVEELLAAYRAVNKNPALLDEGVTGNPDLLKPHELHGPAWDIVRPFFEVNRQRAFSMYQELAGSGRAVTGLRGMLPSAYEGRVDTAFLPAEAHRWGKFEFSENALELHEEPKPGDDDLFNLIAVQTVLHRGTVYMVGRSEMPNGSEAAAILRY